MNLFYSSVKDGKTGIILTSKCVEILETQIQNYPQSSFKFYKPFLQIGGYNSISRRTYRHLKIVKAFPRRLVEKSHYIYRDPRQEGTSRLL